MKKIAIIIPTYNELDNIETLINLADYYSHKAEFDKALDIINQAIEKTENNSILELIRIKIMLKALFQIFSECEHVPLPNSVRGLLVDPNADELLPIPAEESHWPVSDAEPRQRGA